MEGGIFGLANIPVFLIFVAVFLVCYLYLSRRSNYPPGPSGLPILGNLLWMSGLRKKGIRQHLALYEESKTYGDIISINVVGQGFVFLHGYETIRDAFVKNADVLSNRPSWLKGIQDATKEGKGVMWQSGNDWKVLRKFVLQTLRDFAVGKTSLEQKIMREVDAANEFLYATDGKPTDVRLLTSMMISNVIYGIVFAKRSYDEFPAFVEEDDSRCTSVHYFIPTENLDRTIDILFDYKDEKLHEIIENLDVLFQSGGGFTPDGMIPIFLLKLFSKEGYNKRVTRLRIIQWIREHIYSEISDHESTFDNENLRDFVDLYLQAKSQHSDENIFNKGNMFRVIMDLFLAGSETTSNTINWSILFMQEYPDIQKKCQDEIFERCGDNVVTWADRGSFPYTEATLLEIQRMSNIAPMSLPHTNEVDVTLGGYFIPRRTVIFANLYSSNMDPRQWDKPEVFNPDRFMEGGKLKKNPALIPFSTGPRVCLGESLAKMEMFLIFTNLLQRFTFCREDDNVKHSFESILDQFTSAPTPYKTRAMKRA